MNAFKLESNAIARFYNLYPTDAGYYAIRDSIFVAGKCFLLIVESRITMIDYLDRCKY